MESERRKARKLTIITLYSNEISDNSIEDDMTNALDYVNISAKGEEFFRELLQTTIRNLEQIDSIIRENSLNWNFDRIAKVDRNILRMALCEFFFFDDLPPSVSIDEALELAKTYGSSDSAGYINGILDAILHNYIESDEKKETSKDA